MLLGKSSTIVLLIVLNFGLGFAETLIREQTTNLTYCNSSRGATLDDFDGIVCFGQVRVYQNGTVTLDGYTIAVVEWQILALERVNSSFFGIALNESGYYYFVNFTDSVIPLPDLNYTEPGKSTWEPTTNRFWTVGKSQIGQQSKFYVVEAAANYTTAFYIIASGERPVDIFWNGTAVIGVVERNFTYFTTPFLVNQRKTTLGSSNQTLLIIDRNSKTVSLIPKMENYTLICWAECGAVIASSSSRDYTSTFVTGPFASTGMQSTYSLPSASIQPLPTWTLHTTVTITVSDTGFPVAQNYHGILVIQTSSTLTVPLPSGEFFEGDIINLFNFAQLQGTFDALEIQSDSCQLYSGTLVYTDTSINLVITSATNLCTNTADRRSLIFPV